mgnify:CR=1 FL=1
MPTPTPAPLRVAVINVTLGNGGDAAIYLGLERALRAAHTPALLRAVRFCNRYDGFALEPSLDAAMASGATFVTDGLDAVLADGRLYEAGLFGDSPPALGTAHPGAKADWEEKRCSAGAPLPRPTGPVKTGS